MTLDRRDYKSAIPQLEKRIKEIKNSAFDSSELLAKIEYNTYEIEREQQRINAIFTDRIEAVNAEVDTLDATKANITNLNATNARVTNLEANKANVTDLTAANARIDTLQTNKANVTDLTAATGRIVVLETNALTANSAVITNLQANKADIDLANVNNAWVQNGVIKNGAIADAQILGMSANKLTAGTIDAANITVLNLNASNITTGTINGQRIGTGSLTLDKLSELIYTEAEVDAIVSDLQNQIDGAIETWTTTDVPTLSNYPASNWTDPDPDVQYNLRKSHVGDVCYVANSQSQYNGRSYRFAEDSSRNFSWVLIEDSDVTAALQRLDAAEGNINGLLQFQSTTGAWITDTDGALTSLRSRTTAVETSLGDKVEASDFSSLTQTVNGISTNLTSLSNTVSGKADGSTVTTLSNRVNNISNTVDGHTSTISSLQSTVSTKADSSTVSTLSQKVNDVSDTVDGHTQTISAMEEEIDTKADGSTVTTLSNTVSTVSNTVSGHTNSISTLTQTTNSLGTRLSTAEGSISTQAGQIALKANSSDVYTKTQTDDLLVDKADSTSVYTKNEADAIVDGINGSIALKANSSSVYTKTQTDGLLDDKADSDSVYTKTEADDLLSSKANANTVYTKTQADALISGVNASIALKADSSSVYTKTQADSLLADKADSDDVYSKTDVDDLLADKADSDSVYTKTEAGVLIDGLNGRINTKAEQSNVYAKTETYSKSEIDQTVSAINLAVGAKADGQSTTASLALKANQATLTSEINASADTMKINANRLNIEGVITAINDDTTTVIDGGKIDADTVHVKAANIDGTLTIGQVNNLSSALADAAWTVTVEVTSIDYNTPTATLRANAYNYGALVTSGIAYQWAKNGTNISGATSRTYTASDINAIYTCTIS